MTPKLRQVYGTHDDWRDAVAKALSFPANMPELIREMWNKNQQIAQDNGTTLVAEDFAMLFVDSNFPQ